MAPLACDRQRHRKYSIRSRPGAGSAAGPGSASSAWQGSAPRREFKPQTQHVTSCGNVIPKTQAPTPRKNSARGGAGRSLAGRGQGIGWLRPGRGQVRCSRLWAWCPQGFVVTQGAEPGGGQFSGIT